MATRQICLPLITVSEVDGGHADQLLARWDHPLGTCDRPFGRQDWLMEIDGRPVAVATSASTVSSTVRLDEKAAQRVGREVFDCGEVVELARIARAPEHPHILRVMLRYWRAYLAERWPFWPVTLAASYSMPGTLGDIYRFDGWINAGKRRPSGGAGTWTSANPEVNRIGDGVKTLWVWPYASSMQRSADERTAA